MNDVQEWKDSLFWYVEEYGSESVDRVALMYRSRDEDVYELGMRVHGDPEKYFSDSYEGVTEQEIEAYREDVLQELVNEYPDIAFGYSGGGGSE